MPLSEHEQRLLDQIERALYQEDPKFASTVRQTDLRSHMRRRLRRAALVLVLGIVLLFTGLVTQRELVGVAGFVVMVGALLLAMTSWKRMGSQGPDLQVVDGGGSPQARRARGRGKSSKRRPGGGGGSFKNRLEERWNRRWDERGRG